MLGRRLIFYFYITPGYKTNPAYSMHFACLKKYSGVFDSAKFFLSVDDLSNKELIFEVASKIVSCGFVENTDFFVVENSPYRESAIFKEELADKLDTLSGLTFFGHTKGVSNVLNPDYNVDSILKWIFGCYYLSLEFMDEVHNQMQIYQPFDQRMFYGSFLRNVLPENGGGTKYGPEYEGTFFWVNCQRLYDYLKENDIPLPRNFGRFYSERFPGDIFPIGVRIGSHKFRYFHGEVSMYNDIDIVLPLLLDDGELSVYNKKYSELI